MYINDSNGGYEVTEDYLNGVSDIDKIKEIYDVMGKLKVVYQNRKILYYENVFGVWSFPFEMR